MEFFDVYDQYGNYLQKTAMRGQRLKDGEYFLVVHVWIENDNGEFLIQQRAKKSDPIPHQWAITSGIPDQGETPVDAAIRETKEELGITLKKSQLNKCSQIVSDHNRYNTITHVYHTYANITFDELNIDKNEVMDTAYVTYEEIMRMVNNKTFWDYSALLGVEDYFSILRSDSACE